MTLIDALKIFKTRVALAKALGITKQAVSAWEEDKPIPENHSLKLKYEIIPNLKSEAETEAALNS